MMAGGLAGSRACDGTDALTWEPIPATWREPASPVTPHRKVSLEVLDGSVTLSDGQPGRSPPAMRAL